MGNFYNGYASNMNYPQIQPQSYLRGRFVNSESEIVPNEIPMDGNPAVFIANDFSTVWIKKWNNKGTIDTNEYSLNAPAFDTPYISNPGTDYLEAINKRFDKIERILYKQNKPRKDGAINE